MPIHSFPPLRPIREDSLFIGRRARTYCSILRHIHINTLALPQPIHTSPIFVGRKERGRGVGLPALDRPGRMRIDDVQTPTNVPL